MTCPDIGTPLSVPIPLSPVKRDLYKTFTHLLTQDCVVDVAVLTVPLAQYQSAIVAFVVLSNNRGRAETLRDGCVLALDQYEVPQFIYGVAEIPYLPPENSVQWEKLSETEKSKDGFVRRSSFDSTVDGDSGDRGSVSGSVSGDKGSVKGGSVKGGSVQGSGVKGKEGSGGSIRGSVQGSPKKVRHSISGNTANNLSMISMLSTSTTNSNGNSVPTSPVTPYPNSTTSSPTKSTKSLHNPNTTTTNASNANNTSTNSMTGDLVSVASVSPVNTTKPPKHNSRHSTGSYFFPGTGSTKSTASTTNTAVNKNRDITLLVDETKLLALALKLHAEQNIIQPRNPIETQIEYVWRAVLNLKGSGVGSGSVLSVTTSFFDMGGDSLKAGQLVNVMRKELQCHITVADLFMAPTIEKMAYRVAKLKCLGGCCFYGVFVL